MTLAGWVLLVAGVVVALVVVDRVVAHLPARGPRPRRPGSGVSGAGMAGGEFIEIFHPPSRHVTEERERLLLDVSLVGDAAPGGPRGPVDLESGVAEIDPVDGADGGRA